MEKSGSPRSETECICCTCGQSSAIVNAEKPMTSNANRPTFPLTVSASMISAVAMRHPDMAFDFALANLAKINERVDASSRSRYVARLASGSSDPAMVNKLNAYAEANLAPSSRGDVEAAIAAIKDRIQQLIGVADRDLDEHIGAFPLQPGQQIGQDIGGEGIARSQAQRACGEPGGFTGCSLCFFGKCEDTFGVAQQRGSTGGQHGRATATVKQACA